MAASMCMTMNVVLLCVFTVFLTCAGVAAQAAQSPNNANSGSAGNITAVLLDNTSNFGVCVYPGSVSAFDIYDEIKGQLTNWTVFSLCREPIPS